MIRGVNSPSIGSGQIFSQKVLLNILNLCDERPNIGAFTMSPIMSPVIYAEKFRVFTTIFVSFWLLPESILKVNQNQSYPPNCSMGRHGSWKNHALSACRCVTTLLEAVSRLLICRTAPRKSKKHERDAWFFSNASMSAHWAIRRVIDLPALPLFAIWQWAINPWSVFTSQNLLKKHARWHIREPEEKCPLCDEKFLYKGAVETHLVRFHGHERQYTCEFCGTQFIHQRHYRRHITKHEKNPTKVYR